MEQYASLLRDVATRANLKTVKQLAAQPGTKAVHRVTVQYDRLRAADTVATITYRLPEEVTLEVIYLGHFGNRPIVRRLTRDTYEALTKDFNALNFDKLADQPNIPFYGVDMWLVERGAAGFVKSLLVAPQVAERTYAQLVGIISTALPEAVREIVS